MFGEIFAPLLPFWSTGGNCSRPPSSFPLFPISDCTKENFYWNPSGKVRKRVHTPFFARKVIKILCHPPHPRGKLFLGSFFVGTKPYLPFPLIIRGKSKIGLLSRRGKNAQISCLGRKEEKKLLPSFSVLCFVQSTDPLSPGCEGNREMLNWRKKKPQSPPKKVCVGVNFSTQVDARPAVCLRAIKQQLRVTPRKRWKERWAATPIFSLLLSTFIRVRSRPKCNVSPK